MKAHESFMRAALALARRAYGRTSPNPMVGALLVQRGEVIGRGWHRGAGEPHAEIEALRDAERRGASTRGATLYATLEPCCTHGLTPPCTDAIVRAGIKRVVAAATDPNPRHRGKGFRVLRGRGVDVISGVLAEDAARLNEAFNHWIVRRTPFVTVKAAMSLDGKIATRGGESKWITGEIARAQAMKLRQGADAILVGVNTVLADNPALTVRVQRGSRIHGRQPLRIILDSQARTPITARLVTDEFASRTIVVVGEEATAKQVRALETRVRVVVSPLRIPRSRRRRWVENQTGIDLEWLMKQLGRENVTSLLVEGGGEVNASFLSGGFAHRIAFFYAPKVIGGRGARPGVGGKGIAELAQALRLREVEWRNAGADLLLTARVVS